MKPTTHMFKEDQKVKVDLEIKRSKPCKWVKGIYKYEGRLAGQKMYVCEVVGADKDLQRIYGCIPPGRLLAFSEEQIKEK